jgi:opacity protein-like surface antigen
MKKVSRSLAVFLFVIAFSLSPFNIASAQIGVYVGVFGSYTLSSDASWVNDNLDYNYDLNVQETGIFGVKFGGIHPEIKYFSLELEYSYLNPDIDRTVLSTSGTDYSAMEGDAKIHNLMFNFIFKYPEGKIHPYLGFGLGASIVDLSLTPTSNVGGMIYSERRSAENTVFSWQVLTGVDIDLANNLSLDIGCRYFNTESKEGDYEVYYNDDHNQADYHNDADHHHGPILDFRTFMVTLGLKFRF